MCNCCNNSTRCSSCNRYLSNCSWYTCPGYRFNTFQPIIRNPISQSTNNMAYLTSATATVGAGASVPLTLNRMIGNATNITTQGGNVVLQPGVYLINYSLTASGDGGVSVGVNVNGVTQPILTQTSATTSTNQNLSNTGIITVSSPNSVITLVNNSTDAITVTNANLIIRQVS